MKNSIWIKFYESGALKDVLTFNEAEEKIEVRMEELKTIGVKVGDRIVVKMNNSIQAVITYLSLLRLKAIAVPVNPQESKIKLDYITENCNPKIIIDSHGEIEQVFKIKNSKYEENNAEKAATIIYTSGTTGQPKGVCLSWENWQNNADALIEHHKLNPNVTIATPLPLFHCNAHGLAMYATYLAKSELILFDKTPDNFLDIINRERVSIASIVPSILHKVFFQTPQWKAHNGFKYFLTAAAPLRGDLLRLIMDSWYTKVIQGYGLTESTNFSCTTPIDLDDHTYREVMFPHPSIGVALDGVEITIPGAKEGEPGQLFINSKSNSIGYWGKELAGRATIETGDIGYYRLFNNRKFYYLRGRLKELINRGGEKIYPLELEAEIRSLGLEADICVFSIPDDKFGEEIGLAVLSPFNFSLLNQIPSYRRPKRVYQVETFFVTSTGKVQRLKLGDYCINNKEAKIIWNHESK